MTQATEQNIHLKPQSISIWTRAESDGEVKVQIQGELELMPNRRYDRVVIEYTVRNAEGRVLTREDSSVDLTFLIDGKLSFSNNLYLKPHVSKGAATLELRASAQMIMVDKPIVMDIPKP